MSLTNPKENEVQDNFDIITVGDPVFMGEESCIQIEKLCEFLQTASGALLTMSGDPLCIRDVSLPWHDISVWDDNAIWSDAPTPLVGEADKIQ